MSIPPAPARPFRVVFGLGLLCLAAVPAGTVRAQTEVSGRIRLMARSLGADYRVKRAGAQRAPLAVFDFACPEPLRQERVGYAVAELLSSELVSASEFTLVERAELARVLQEQALGQTGAVDEHSAVQLGKLAGAALAVFGSVDRLGPSYQVSARLADVATGEVLAVAVQELPVTLFEAEAGRFLKLVPEEQAIGIFIGLGDGFGASFKAADPVTLHQSPTVTESARSDIVHGQNLALGLRYQVARWLQLEASFRPQSFNLEVKTTLDSPAIDQAASTPEGRAQFSAIAYDLSVNWVRPLAPRWRMLAGAGAELLSFDAGSQNGGNGPHIGWTGGPPPSSLASMALLTNTDLFRPHLQAGLEWKPQARLGWSLVASVYPLPATAHVHAFLMTTTGSGQDVDTGSLGDLTLPRVALATSLALYF